ncbi:maleylpyruvate isomerase family mycothiol-dependent enzyme [Arthrobacter woluwensis]|uniref:maleylpyruvate isomerase family mycothiol-dependent enzyme n=1 Tax=Arthrobacter woluwensis TaxID=156980 RepID=UPI001AAFB7E7|nr:maleylpyruvate isomerase family mycothiol-dependent enzyme [Arthrobacter woluwensis]QTF70866.1 maleylpyruvate isomerase family mycothiol-dependent enzyme [Arthrobacter woluwensis]
MNEIWNVVHKERRALAADLAEVEPDAWDTPSLCPGWTVHDVVAHLVNDAKTTWAGFAGELLKARFDFDALNEHGVARERRADPRETLENLRAVSGRTSSAPAPRVTRLVEAFVHGEDIRRPLGIRRSYPPGPLLEALKHQLATPTGFGGGKERAAGVILEATDTDFLGRPTSPAVNAAPVVRGSTLALLLAVSGRPVRPGELDGDGASAFAVTSGDG